MDAPVHGPPPPPSPPHDSMRPTIPTIPTVSARTHSQSTERAFLRSLVSLQDALFLARCRDQATTPTAAGYHRFRAAFACAMHAREGLNLPGSLEQFVFDESTPQLPTAPATAKSLDFTLASSATASAATATSLLSARASARGGGLAATASSSQSAGRSVGAKMISAVISTSMRSNGSSSGGGGGGGGGSMKLTWTIFSFSLWF